MCTWDLGDGTTLKTDPSTFENVIKHRYQAVGNYLIKLSCTNSLGRVSASHELPVEIPISGFGIMCPLQFVEVDFEYQFTILTQQGSRWDTPFFL